MLRGLRRHTARLLRRAGILAQPPGRTPDFVVLGAQKAGTTSLAAWLGEHPSCWIASEKEVHFFDTAYDRGLPWYRTRFGKAPQERLAGEVTPYYLFHPLAAERMARDIPNARLVAILREPVARAVSGYRHSRRHHGETRGIEEALADEPRALRDDLARLAADPGAACPALQTRSYHARGLYAEQLERFLRHFPREQLHVMFFEELVAAPGPSLDALCGFLGVPARGGVLPWRNAGADDAAGAPDAVLAALRERYREPNARLSELLGRPLPW